MGIRRGQATASTSFVRWWSTDSTGEVRQAGGGRIAMRPYEPYFLPSTHHVPGPGLGAPKRAHCCALKYRFRLSKSDYWRGAPPKEPPPPRLFPRFPPPSGGRAPKP